MKSPFACSAKPAFVSRPSVNLYFGTNIGVANDGLTIRRTAYAVGSGVASIGLDPRENRIFSIFNRLSQLVSSLVEVIRNKTPHKKFVCNFVSVKVYYWYKNEKGECVKKDTNWHCDITLDKQGKPCSNNSQVPGTPVGIITFGSKKKLLFRQGKSKTEWDSHTVFEISQKSGTFVVLDGADEILNSSGKRWSHKSTSCEDENGVTFSLMLRQVQKQVTVCRFNNTIVDPKIGPKKLVQFEKGKDLLETEYYKQERETMHTKMEKLFNQKIDLSMLEGYAVK